MLRGCSLALALYAALTVGYYFWLDTTFELPYNIFGALGAAFVVLLCLGALGNAWTAWKDWSLLLAAERGQAPRDGRHYAAAGQIHPTGQPLIAPFSGEECILCEYDLSRHKRKIDSTSDQNPGSDFAGFLMVPSVIRGQQREVRVLGFPIIEGFSESPCVGYAAARRAIDFLTTREFENRTGVKMVSVLGVFGELWSDEDGHVEKNIRLGTVSLPEVFPPELEAAIDRELAHEAENPPVVDDEELEVEGEEEEEEELEDDFEDEDEDDDELGDGGQDSSRPDIPRMTEKRVPLGASVCAIGIYNELRGGLAPPRGSRHPTRMFRGTPEKLAQGFRGKVTSFALGGLIFLVLANAATFGVMQAYRHSESATRDRARIAFEAVEKGDVARLESLVRRGMDINIRNTAGDTLLMETQRPAVAEWLIARQIDVNARGRDGQTALMAAVDHDQPQIVRQLIAAKADLDARSTNYNRTALMHAVSQHRDEIAALLRQAGAKDDVITAATGEPLPPDGGEQLKVVKEYLAAVHTRDDVTLSRLFASGRSFVDTDWDLWHRSRPVEIAEWTGFARADDATIVVGGTSGGGYPVRWHYQLRRDGGQWKIAREEDDL